MELFPQSNQGGVFNGHHNRKSTSLISTDEEETISQELVIISDDASEDPTRTKEGGDRDNIRRRRRSVSRRRWTLLEDCKLVEVVASHKQKFVWKTIAAGFPQRTSNSCRLRWIKMFKPEDTLFTENRWSEMAMLMGDRVINQWRLMIAHNIPDFYTSISANHPLKRSSVQNVVAPMINGPYVGGDNNGVGDTSMVLSRTSGLQPLVHPAIDLSLSLGNGHDQNSVAVAATTTTTAQRPPLYEFL